MKNLIVHIKVLVVTLLAFSCNDDFIKDKLEYSSTDDAFIAITPDMTASNDAYDHDIYFKNVGNASFKITKTPSWLKFSSLSGKFTNGYATLNCKADAYDDFSEVGIYYTYMTLLVEGKGNKYIQIAYINEGNPIIETELSYINPINGRITIKNTSSGILLFVVAQTPEWLLVSDQKGSLGNGEKLRSIMVPPYRENIISFSYIPTIITTEVLSGTIVILSTDNNKPVIEQNVQMDLGNPSFRSISSNTINLGNSGTSERFSFANDGSGYLAWKIEGCPVWLNISPSLNGFSIPKNQSVINFNCNRELLSPGKNTATIYLKTNDKDMQSYSIIVTALN
jgi:hypothetical protein